MADRRDSSTLEENHFRSFHQRLPSRGDPRAFADFVDIGDKARAEQIAGLVGDQGLVPKQLVASLMEGLGFGQMARDDRLVLYGEADPGDKGRTILFRAKLSGDRLLLTDRLDVTQPMRRFREMRNASKDVTDAKAELNVLVSDLIKRGKVLTPIKAPVVVTLSQAGVSEQEANKLRDAIVLMELADRASEPSIKQGGGKDSLPRAANQANLRRTP
jgi:hypothetical protein